MGLGLELGLGGVQSGVLFGRVDVPWRGALTEHAGYLPEIQENACATARRVRDTQLWEHRLAQAQNILNYQHIVGDELVNWTDGDWDDLWDKPADQ